ncbi:MAG: hypothetical protein ACRD04_12980 [Terriglobales bacterium]
MSGAPATLDLPSPLPRSATVPEREGLLAGLSQGWQSWRQRWVCMGPDCSERYGLRAWCKLPARVQLQEGWCCSQECFQSALEVQAHRLLHEAVPRAVRQHRFPLGLLLLSQGRITQTQLRAALQEQQQRGGRVGEWLVRRGAVPETDVAATVALQWACPTFPLAESHVWQQLRGWVPLPLLRTLGMLPLYFAPAQRKLYVGFTQTLDFNVLAALGQMLECATEACIVTDSAWAAALEQLRSAPGAASESVELEDMDGALDIAGVVRQYARYAEARHVRLAAIGPFLWVRIRGRRTLHLTFRTARPRS